MKHKFRRLNAILCPACLLQPVSDYPVRDGQEGSQLLTLQVSPVLSYRLNIFSVDRHKEVVVALRLHSLHHLRPEDEKKPAHCRQSLVQIDAGTWCTSGACSAPPPPASPPTSRRPSARSGCSITGWRATWPAGATSATRLSRLTTG